MLGKLLKYEIKATSRTFLPLFGVLLLFTLINKLFFIINPSHFSLPQGISMTVYVVTLVGIIVVTLLITIQRFYKNLLGDEGYLMFTLPVRPWQLITSKLLVSGMWNIASTAVAILSVLVMVLGSADLYAFPRVWTEMMQDMRLAMGMSPALFFFELALLILGGLAMGIMVIYLSIALGHQLNSKKLLGSFGAFLLTTTVIQSVTTFVVWLLSKLLSGHGFGEWLNSLSFAAGTQLGMWTGIVYEIIITAACFALTNWLLKKRLNLE